MYTILGTGILTWHPSERRSDRYGTVYLMQDGCTSLTSEPAVNSVDTGALKALVGKQGKLVALVKSPRVSTHVGDLSRKIFPSTPEDGEMIVFGDGELFTHALASDDGEAGFMVGLSPSDGRLSDWLNPKQLYRAHEQLVELQFHPFAAGSC